MKYRKASGILVFSALLIGGLSLSWTAFGRDTLTLRVNDAIGEPGGLVAVVVRTYASRPAGQGQICIIAGFAAKRAAEASVATPFGSLVESVVFASRRDGVSVASMQVGPTGQEILLEFSSASGTINRTDGPLGVLYFRLRKNVVPGQTFDIAIDPGMTAVFDPAGNSIPIRPRGGELTIRAASDPYEVEAEGDKIAPGQVATLGVETYEPFAISKGRVALRYDPAIQAGRAKVKMDRKYGSRRFRVERSTPGLLVINFRSPRNDLNLVPGQILRISMPTSSAVPVGTRSRLDVDSDLSFLLGPDGSHLPVSFESNSVRFGRGGGGGGGDDGDDDADSGGSGGDDSSGDDDDDDDSSGDDDDDDGDSDGDDDDDDSSGDDDDDDSSGDDDDDDDDSDGDDDDDDDSSGDDDDDDSDGDDDDDDGS